MVSIDYGTTSVVRLSCGDCHYFNEADGRCYHEINEEFGAAVDEQNEVCDLFERRREDV